MFHRFTFLLALLTLLVAPLQAGTIHEVFTGQTYPSPVLSPPRTC